MNSKKVDICGGFVTTHIEKDFFRIYLIPSFIICKRRNDAWFELIQSYKNESIEISINFIIFCLWLDIAYIVGVKP